MCIRDRPVSAFEGNVNGEWEQGASAYEKRGTAVMVPEWNAEKCIQCNQCAFVCSHATIRPFCLTADEAAAAPESTKLADTKPKASEYKFTKMCIRDRPAQEPENSSSGWLNWEPLTETSETTPGMLSFLRMFSVSYTHLDVYKRQVFSGLRILQVSAINRTPHMMTPAASVLAACTLSP